MNVKRNNNSDSHDCAAISSSYSNKREEKNFNSPVFLSKQQQKKKSSTLTLTVRWYVFFCVILSQSILQAAAVITTPISRAAFYVNSGPSIAVAVSGGIPIIVFFDYSDKDPLTGLYYIRCGDASCSASNTIKAIASGNVGSDVAIAIASSGFAVISYCDWGNYKLMIARCNDLVCSSPNNVLVDGEFENVGQYTSIALQATTNYPVISYYDLDNANLKVAACSSVDCTTKTITEVDGALTRVGKWSSLKLRSNGNPTIVYYDDGALKLMFIACGDFACTPAGNTYRTLNTGNSNNLGYYASLALDSQDRAVISYYDFTFDKLVLTRCSDVLCSSASTNYVNAVGGMWSSVVVRPNGLPIISYIDSSWLQLKIANCLNTVCSQASITTPDTTPSVVHLLTSIALLGSSNFVVAYAAGTDAVGSLHVYTDTYTNILNCPEHSQLLSNGNCECEKGYYGDSVSTRVITPVVGAVCTFKCAYKGATCIETNDCCKPATKFVCQNSQCVLCSKLGSICTRNTQCCSGRCNKKRSICKEKKL